MKKQEFKSKQVKIKRNFKIAGVATFLIGIVGLVLLAFTDVELLHPYIYTMLIVIGIGWFLTACSLRIG